MVLGMTRNRESGTNESGKFTMTLPGRQQLVIITNIKGEFT